MKTATWASVAAFSTSVAAHGFVKSVSVDGAIYPGFNPHRDTRVGAKRIAFGFLAGFFNIDGTAAVQSTDTPAVACNIQPTVPAELAEARAGSEIKFRWTEWLPSHRGPITTWMAPYEGNISAVDVNKLKFFKIDEAGLFPNQQWGELNTTVPWSVKPNWATDKMIAGQELWNVTIPWDIKPGTYVVRHELLALHFATTNSNYRNWGTVGPQFYPSCYNVRIAGKGTATPPGVTFPGAYKMTDPGIVFDIYQNKTEYPIPGPRPYVPKGPAPVLAVKAPRVISPMGDPVADAEYRKAMDSELQFFASIGNGIYALGG